jgi:hypothetical protein
MTSKIIYVSSIVFEGTAGQKIKASSNATLRIEVQKPFRRFDHDSFTLRIDSSADGLGQGNEQFASVPPAYVEKINAPRRLNLSHSPYFTMPIVFGNYPAPYQVRDIVVMRRQRLPFFMPDQDAEVAKAIRVLNRIDAGELQDDPTFMHPGTLYHRRVRHVAWTFQIRSPQAVEARWKVGKDFGRHLSPAALWFDDARNCQESL